MAHLIADLGTLAVAQTVTVFVPEVVLRNGGTICSTDGTVCTDDPSATGLANGPTLSIDPTCPDLAGNDGVDDLLFLLAAFGRTCSGGSGR